VPRYFNKDEIAELRSLSKKDKCEHCHGKGCDECRGASVLDALESKTANEEGQCPACGGPSELLGQLGHRTHYRCVNCGMDHSSTNAPQQTEPWPISDDEQRHHPWESRVSDILAEPAQHNPDLIVPPAAEPRIEPCTHCGALIAPFVVEHKLSCPHCGNAQNPIRWDQAMSSRQAALPFDQTFIPQSAPQVNIQQEDRQHWGDVYPCPSCGHAVRRDFQECPGCGEHSVPPAPGVGPAGNQPQPIRWGKTAEISMPPQGVPMEQKETALPYNPGAYEGEVEGMHPAAQYTYQRAVAQGAAPQAAMAAAQEKQGEMMKRTQEGQNTEGVQIPVVNSKVAANPDEDACNLCNGTGKDENSSDDCARCDGSGKEPDQEREKQPREGHVISDRSGFVSAMTIKRVSHII